MSKGERIHFKLMSLIQETLYGLFKASYKALRTAGLEPGLEVLEVPVALAFSPSRRPASLRRREASWAST